MPEKSKMCHSKGTKKQSHINWHNAIMPKTTITDLDENNSQSKFPLFELLHITTSVMIQYHLERTQKKKNISSF